MGNGQGLLGRILAQKRRRLQERRGQVNLEKLKEQAQAAPPCRPFGKSLTSHGRLALIAEIKRASPSRGLLMAGLDAASLAQEYEMGGAAALSVLTEEDFFLGSTDDLIEAKSATSLPMLRKDFIIDPYQLYEAKVMGADAVLLIARCLKPSQLHRLSRLAFELGMEPLVEVTSVGEARLAMNIGCRIIGINNRDLTTLRVDLSVTERIASAIASDHLIVSESGIHNRRDVLRVERAGARAILVGEALVAAARKGESVQKRIQALTSSYPNRKDG